jgi:hypothetical protein
MGTYWSGPVPQKDDFGITITNKFVDGKSLYGPWAIMAYPYSWDRCGQGPHFGTGLGQLYERQPDGRWLKTRG